jgi:LCP family protein required for cell wall assembly
MAKQRNYRDDNYEDYELDLYDELESLDQDEENVYKVQKSRAKKRKSVGSVKGTKYASATNGKKMASSVRRKNGKRKKKSKRVLWICLSIALIFIIGLGVFALKVLNDASDTVDEDMHEEAVRSGTNIELAREKPVELKENEPFSVLLLGVDTGALGRTEQGRSDTMIIVAINPGQKRTLMMSIERDIKVDIIGYGSKNKMNAAYAFGGVGMAMDTIESYVGIPIDHFVTVNMGGLQTLVDAVGGIEVENDLNFTYEGTHFPVGTLQLNGETALKFSRMRYTDPNGDYGRQMRQQKVIQGVINKALSINGVAGYQGILDAMGGSMKTDLSFDDMMTLAVNYRSALDTIERDQIKGSGYMENGVSYQSVTASELERVRTRLKEVLELE